MKTLALVVATSAVLLTGCVAPAPYYDRPAPPRSVQGDRDRDGVPNRADRDRDGDGVPNRYDRTPNNPNRN